uniref:Methyltransferase-like protein 2 n=1 Tax=Cajanus cajan TaxID=3821 RepID=A0A151TZ03_CAJCA|nr:Methyltransferase-like protein 2 [Cajanus cajan]
MEGEVNAHKLSLFQESGIYLLDDSNAVFMDPVRVLNRFYHRFSVSPSTYYSRSFKSPTPSTEPKRKRKRKSEEPPPLNDRELIALQRHKDARPLLLAAHECLMKSSELLDALKTLKSESTRVCLAAPQLEVTLSLRVGDADTDADPHQPQNGSQDSPSFQCFEQKVFPAFNNLVANDTMDDAVAEILNNQYIMPRESCFYMSDLGQIRNLIPAHADSGFNLIIVDPPWENASAHQKSRYQTLPNRYFLSLPIKQLTHSEGALVALWVTNREKLRCFVENELFPAWGVSYAANFYWLKVKENGSWICDLDHFHHRPYECLILGYSTGKVNNTDNQSKFKPVKNDRVIMSIPGDYSRKPPIADLLLDHVPGVKPPRCIELFAREIMGGCVAWGNEPLHFQDSKYFFKKMDK